MLRITALTNLYPTPADPSQGTFVEQQVKGLRQAGVDMQVIYVDRRDKGMSVYRDVGRSLKEVVAIHDPDLIHVMYGGVLADRATRAQLTKPVVVSFCGSDLFGDARNHWWRRVAGACGVRASQQSALRAAGIIVKSPGLMKALDSGVDKSKVWILPNGIDLDRFQPMDREACQRQLGWANNRLHILFTNGKGNPCKRIDLAAEAVRILNTYGVRAELNILPGVPHAEVPVWLNAADVVILTSVHEGSPNIIKEALACDRPIVSVEVGDVRERINNVEGCHLAKADPHELASALREVSMGPRYVDGRSRMQELSLQAVSRRLIEIYETVLLRWALMRETVCN
jgi:glycosyltransferase involved in cell wall biosynthesis